MPSINIICKVIKKEDIMHGKTTFLFDIPIYRCSEKICKKQLDKDEKKYLTNLGIPKNTHTYEMAKQHWLNSTKPWRYNEIVGWFKISIRGMKICGKPEYHVFAQLFFQNKRIQKNQTNKKFVLLNCHENVSVPIANSDSIFKIIIGFIDTISKRNYERLYPIESSVNLSRYFLDKEQIESLGRYVNWSALIKSTLK